jgi:hypothetical protein
MFGILYWNKKIPSKSNVSNMLLFACLQASRERDSASLVDSRLGRPSNNRQRNHLSLSRPSSASVFIATKCLHVNLQIVAHSHLVKVLENAGYKFKVEDRCGNFMAANKHAYKKKLINRAEFDLNKRINDLGNAAKHVWKH